MTAEGAVAAGQPRPAPRLATEGISKRFAGVQALRDVTLEARSGEVLALVGENGAGKSTLLKILTGAEQPDRGRLCLDGTPIVLHTPADAHANGIRVIAQEPEIIPHVSVAENIYVGDLPRRGRLVSRRALHAQVQEDLQRHGFTALLRPDQPGHTLSPAQRQLVEILRALISDVRVIAFDEPTSSLSDAEVDILFRLIGRLRAQDIAIVYVSHRLKEIFRVADRVTVLRDGAVVGTTALDGQTTEATLIRMMVGRDLAEMFTHRPDHRPASSRVVLAAEQLSSDEVHDVSFELHAGEVLGLAGLVGAGRSELAHALAGSSQIRSGRLLVHGKPVRIRNPTDALKAGIALAPEERKAQALLLHRSVRDNISLAVLDRLRVAHIVRRRAERTLARRFAERLNIRTPTIEELVATLSGGNQQKVVLARWLARNPKILILDEPTRGVDVGAKAEIYTVIRDLAAEGIAVLLISSELPEVIGLCDRILVMRGGRISGELDSSEATEERVLALAVEAELDEVSRTGEPGP